MPFFPECATKAVLKRRRKKRSAAILSTGGARRANGASFLTIGLSAATEIVAGLAPGAGTHMESLLE